MTDRTFGGLTLFELKELRRNSADGAKFYMALLDASPDFFLLADEVEQLEAVIEKLVSTLEAAAGEMEEKGQGGAILDSLRDSLSDPVLKKILSSG
jgi:hypothetical protein